MRKYIIHSITLLYILALVGCRKDLCYTHPHNGSLEIRVDWSLLPSTYRKPTGIAVTFNRLPEQTNKLTYNFLPDGGTKSITQGNYSILMTNNDYDLINIRNSSIWDQMEAYTPPVTHKAYNAPPKNVLSATESLSRTGISEADLLMVSSEHTNTTVKNLSEDEVQVIVLKPQSRTIPIMVRIPLEDGIQYVSQARGFLIGVSPSVKVISGVKSQEPASLLYEYGSALGGKELRASFSIFGFVDASVTSNSYKAGLEVLLIDGSVLFYEFEVNDQITDNLRLVGGEIILDEVKRIDKVEPPATGEGFKPDIGSWDDEEIIIPIS